jgi:hypothetical protein
LAKKKPAPVARKKVVVARSTTVKPQPAAKSTAKAKPAMPSTRATEAKVKLTKARTNETAKAGATATKNPAAAGTKKDKLGRASDGGEVTASTGATKRPDLEQQQPPSIASRFTRRIVRPRDLLVLDFTFVNLKVATHSSGKLQLVRRDSGSAAFIVIGFPPQHLLEQAFFETAAETPIVKNTGKPADPDQSISNAAVNAELPEDTDIPVRSRLAEASRLVFRSPSGFTSLTYTLEDVLAACRNWELSVAPTATPPDPRVRFVPGLEMTSVSAWTAGSGVTKRVAAKTTTKVSTAAKTTSTKMVAAHAFTAAVIAETRDQWYAQRSPLQRRPAATAEIQEVVDILETIKVLPELAPPGINHTAIEAPTRLIISPNSYGAWVHATDPVESVRTGRVELWHTRLAVRAAQGVTEKDDFRRAIRAIWSPDVIADNAFVEIPHDNFPFRAPLDANDRHQIVHLSANHRLYVPDSQPKKRIVPQPIDVDRLMLSSLGAWMNVHGAWTPPAGMSVENWRNRGTMGRDHYVRVVYAGRLYPFGHRASLIKVTERKFHAGNKGNAAFLRQRMFLVVREPYVLLGNTGDVIVNELGDSEQLDLKMPLKSARLTTLVTPNLDDPNNHVCAVVKTTPESTGPNSVYKQKLFWPYVSGEPFRFHVQFEDETGALLNVAMPLFFVGNDVLVPATGKIPDALATALAQRYSKGGLFQSMRRVDFGSQRVQFAESLKHGDTSFEVSAMEFSLAAISGRLVSGMMRAAVTVPALKHLARKSDVPELEYAAPYLKHGFGDGNAGEVFFKLLHQDATKMDFSTQGDRAGGFLSPNMAINGLSRTLGPFGGKVDRLAGGKFNPAEFFANLGDALPKLFGCINIIELLDEIGLGELSKLPRFITENLTAAHGLLDDIARMQVYIGQLESQLSALSAALTSLKNAAATTSASIGILLADPPDAGKLNAFTSAFESFCAAAKTLHANLSGFGLPSDTHPDVAFAFTQFDQLLAKFAVGLEAPGSAADLAEKIAGSLEALNEQRIKFEWTPAIKNWAISGSNWIFEQRPNGGLKIAVELAAQSGTSKEPSLDVACRLQNFNLNLIAPETFLRLKFTKIEFISSSRSKPDVNVVFDDIEFVGVLSFVETLRTLIPMDGFSDPPALAISEEGIEASFSLGLPTIAVGVFSLANLNLGAALTLPFVGNEPLSVRFNFCERSDPFRITVWIFGGGGFFAVTVTPAGCQILEASFEFGASCALDFGVASGSVSVMAGIYFKIEVQEASLTGYFNVKGCVDVMGLISASIELNLELTYQFSSGKCVGRATMIIEIDVLLFSGSVEIECEKKFAGSNGDPSFVQIMAPYNDPVTGEAVDPWPEYCEAFAA